MGAYQKGYQSYQEGNDGYNIVQDTSVATHKYL